MTFWLRFGLITFAAIAVFIAGHKVARLQCQADKAETLRAAAEARKVDESFAQGVSAAYEGVAAQLRRLSTVNRVELTREVQKIEYRCPLPVDALRMLNAGIDAANAPSSEPHSAVPPASSSDGKGLGGISPSGFGPDGDVR